MIRGNRLPTPLVWIEHYEDGARETPPDPHAFGLGTFSSYVFRTKRAPYLGEEFCSFYETVWKARRTQDVVLIKTLLYTGVRVSELVNVRLDGTGWRQRADGHP